MVLQRLRNVLGQDAVLAQLATTGPTPPFVLDPTVKDDLCNRTLALTAPAGMAGAPVESLPVAAVDGLSVALALVQLPGSEGYLVGVASALDDSG